MVAKRVFACIVCPKSCKVGVETENGVITGIDGYSCKRGKNYVVSEINRPERMLTTTVRVRGGKLPLVPVKSHKPIPKGLLFECMKVINSIETDAPVGIGEVLVENILGTGVNIIAAREIEKREDEPDHEKEVCNCS